MGEWVMYGYQRGDRRGLPGTGRRFDVRGLGARVERDGRIHENRNDGSVGTGLRRLGQPTLPAAARAAAGGR